MRLISSFALILILGLSGLAPSYAHGATACSAAVSEQASAGEREHFAKHYPTAFLIEKNLDRLGEIVSSRQYKTKTLLSFGREVPLPLTNHERAFFLDSIERNIDSAEHAIEKILATSSVKTATNDPAALRMGLMTVKNLLQTRKESLTYTDALLIAYHSAVLQKYVSAARRHLQHPDQSDFVMTIFTMSADFEMVDQQVMQGIPLLAKKNMIFFPFDGEVNIFDFNYLVGTGLAPGGLIADYLKADNREFDPQSFLGHDRAHARLTMPGRMTPRQRARWLDVLSRVDRLPDREKNLVHLVIFNLSHEEFLVTPKKILSPSYIQTQIDSAMVARLHERVLEEEAFGIASIAASPPSHAELRQAALRFLKILTETP